MIYEQLYNKTNFDIQNRSTVSGVGAGIRRISEICFILGTFLLMMAFFLDDTFFLLNLVNKVHNIIGLNQKVFFLYI